MTPAPDSSRLSVASIEVALCLLWGGLRSHGWYGVLLLKPKHSYGDLPAA